MITSQLKEQVKLTMSFRLVLGGTGKFFGEMYILLIRFCCRRRSANHRNNLPGQGRCNSEHFLGAVRYNHSCSQNGLYAWIKFICIYRYDKWECIEAGIPYLWLERSCMHGFRGCVCIDIVPLRAWIDYLCMH